MTMATTKTKEKNIKIKWNKKRTSIQWHVFEKKYKKKIGKN